jgi:hypothetical protein
MLEDSNGYVANWTHCAGPKEDRCAMPFSCDRFLNRLATKREHTVMSSRSFNRKDFLVLTVTTVAAGALTACGDDPAPGGGTSGSGGTPGGGSGGMAGTPAAGGSTSGAGGGTSGSTSGGGGAGGSGTAGGGAGGGGAGGGSGGGGAGGGSGGGGAGGGGGGACGDLSAKSSGTQHTHMLMIPAADITAGATKKYETSTDSNHSHWVEITAADFTALKAGMEV